MDYSLIPTIVFTVRDAKGADAVFTVHTERLDDSDFTAGATYESMADNIMQDFFPLIDGRIVNAHVKIPISIDTGVVDQTGRPLANSDVEEGAIFVFRTESGHPVRMRVPTFKESLFIPDTQDVLIDGVVETFVDTIINGPDAIAGVGEDRFNVTDNRGSDIVQLEKARDSFTRTRKRVTKRMIYTP